MRAVRAWKFQEVATSLVFLALLGLGIGRGIVRGGQNDDLPRMAAARDIEVHVSKLRPHARQEQADEALVYACIVNVSKEPVRLYIPGFTGPVLNSPDGRGVPLELRRPPRGSAEDY